MTLNFSDSLNTKLEEVERPPLPPLGTYRFNVMKHPEFKENVNDQWDIVTFLMKGVEAMEDVDVDELQEFGAASSIVIPHAFMFNKEDKAAFQQTEFRLRQFLVEHLQIEKADKMGFKEAFAASVNHQCLGVVSYRADKNDPEVQYPQIRKTAPVE